MSFRNPAATPGGIEAQEVAGRASFVANETLPIDCPREQLQGLGFRFGEPIDKLFVAVQFPKGWSKRLTKYSIWSDIVDQKGRMRGRIFYKGAFNDERAYMYGLQTRYRVALDCEQGYSVQMSCQDCDKTLLFYAGSAPYGQLDQLLTKCKDWLAANFPKWEDPLAYWD